MSESLLVFCSFFSAVTNQIWPLYNLKLSRVRSLNFSEQILFFFSNVFMLSKDAQKWWNKNMDPESYGKSSRFAVLTDYHSYLNITPQNGSLADICKCLLPKKFIELWLFLVVKLYLLFSFVLLWFSFLLVLRQWCYGFIEHFDSFL